MASEFSKFIGYLFDKNDLVDIDESYRKRLVSFVHNILLKSPRAVYLFNKWANDIYDNMSPDERIKYVKDIIKILKMWYNDFHTNKPLYNRKEELFKYMEIKNENDLRLLYSLFVNDVVTINDDSVKKSKSKIKSDIFDGLKPVETKNDIELRNKIKTVDELNKYIRNLVENNKYCIGCKLYKKETVILDSNANNIDEIDFMIIGINPGVTEVEEGKPFVGKSGQLLRGLINDVFGNEYKYLISNVILCHTPNQNDLKGIINDVLDKCKYIDEIIKLVRPKVIIGFGDIVKQKFNITGRVSSIYNKTFEYNDIPLLITIHPSGALRNRKKYVPMIEETLNKAKSIINKIKNKESQTFKINNINSIDELPDELTFLDVRILEEENKYLILMLDEDGNKHYFQMPFTHEVFVYRYPIPQHCDYIMDINELEKIEIKNYNDLTVLRNTKLNELKELIENGK